VNASALSPLEALGLKAEVAILRALDHPNVLQLYEVFEEEEATMSTATTATAKNKPKTTVYLVTEFLCGGELFDRVCAKTAYSEADARRLALDLLASVAYLHSVGVVHRDLKPENILLRSSEDDVSFAIADFGFAVHATKELAEGSEKRLLGTADYVAPEVLSRRQYGYPVDVWACGVICYILLCGYPPFYDESDAGLFEKIKAGVVDMDSQFWGCVSEPAQSAVRAMLTVDPAKRPSAATLLATHLWFTEGASSDPGDLTPAVAKLKSWAARKKLKAGVKALMAVRRMSALGAGLRKAAAEC